MWLTPPLSLYTQNIFESNVKTGYYGSLTAVVSDNKGGWIAGGVIQTLQDRFTPVYFMKYNQAGNEIWRKSISLMEFGALNQILLSQDGNYLLAGGFRPCDLGYGIAFLQKINPSGTAVWTRQYILAKTFAGAAIQESAELQNGSILSRADSLLFHVSPSGDSLWTVNPQRGMLYSIIVNKQNQFLAGTSSGILRTDSTGKQIAFYSFPGPVKSLAQAADYSYYFISGLSFIHTDSAFQVIASKSLGAQFSSVLSCKWNNNGGCVAGIDSLSKQTRVLSLDWTFGQIQTFLFLDTPVHINGFACHDSIIILAGHEQAGTQSESPLLKSFSYGGINNASKSDAGILSIKADTVMWIQLTGTAPLEYEVAFRLQVTVKNFGTDTLHNLTLNAHSNVTAVCESYNYFQNFFGLNLLPGDSVTLKTSVIQEGYYSFAGNNPVISFCLWTAAPNQRLDINHANDRNCGNITVPFNVGIAAHAKLHKLIISPDPANSQIKIDLPEGAATGVNYNLEILNVIGQTVMLQARWNNEIQLDISDFKNGIYLIRLNSDHFSGTARFVKNTL